MTDEWHYAPVSGSLAVWRDGQPLPHQSWSAFHQLMATFLHLRAEGSLTLQRTQTYGHPHFHGHSGRVDIYA